VTNANLARRVYSAVRISGQFTLRSGRTAIEYFDKYQFEADPILLDEIGKEMAKLVPSGTEVLAGLEMGGIAVFHGTRRVASHARSDARGRHTTEPSHMPLAH